MTESLYFEIYNLLWDIWDTTLSNVISTLIKSEWTTKHNPTVSEEFGWLFDIWDYNENVLYYQSDDVGIALKKYLTFPTYD